MNELNIIQTAIKNSSFGILFSAMVFITIASFLLPFEIYNAIKIETLNINEYSLKCNQFTHQLRRFLWLKKEHIIIFLAFLLNFHGLD